MQEINRTYSQNSKILYVGEAKFSVSHGMLCYKSLFATINVRVEWLALPAAEVGLISSTPRFALLGSKRRNQDNNTYYKCICRAGKRPNPGKKSRRPIKSSHYVQYVH